MILCQKKLQIKIIALKQQQFELLLYMSGFKFTFLISHFKKNRNCFVQFNKVKKKSVK